MPSVPRKKKGTKKDFRGKGAHYCGKRMGFASFGLILSLFLISWTTLGKLLSVIFCVTGGQSLSLRLTGGIPGVVGLPAVTGT